MNRLQEKSSKNKRNIHITAPQLIIIASKLELQNLLSEVIIAPKCGPLAMVEEYAIS